jgi:hypothetical protein
MRFPHDSFESSRTLVFWPDGPTLENSCQYPRHWTGLGGHLMFAPRLPRRAARPMSSSLAPHKNSGIEKQAEAL